MKSARSYYKRYSKYGLEGYYIPVRNTFSNNIEREFIPVEAKDDFESSYGDRIITDTEFIDWYTKHTVSHG